MNIYGTQDNSHLVLIYNFILLTLAHWRAVVLPDTTTDNFLRSRVMASLLLDFWGFLWREDYTWVCLGIVGKVVRDNQWKLNAAWFYCACSTLYIVDYLCFLHREHRENFNLWSWSSLLAEVGGNLSPDLCHFIHRTGLEQKLVTAWPLHTHSHSSWGSFHSFKHYKSPFLWDMQRHVPQVLMWSGGLLVFSL